MNTAVCKLIYKNSAWVSEMCTECQGLWLQVDGVEVHKDHSEKPLGICFEKECYHSDIHNVKG